MERQIPKNVRQIGNVSGSPKIYVEDYVDTFFTQLCEKAGETPVGAFLVGDFQKTDGEDYVYIYGAVQMHELKMSGKEYLIDEETWKHAYEDCKQYFEDGEMLGWFVAHAGAGLEPSEAMIKLHKKSFPRENTVFVVKDPVEQDERYFVHQMNDLMEIGGHYTYYEKNPCMQNYMISCRKKNGVCPSETVEDRAAKDFRSIVRDRGGRKYQKRSNRLMYAMSTCLVLLVVVMGIVTMNRFDKMKDAQATFREALGVSETNTTGAKSEETQDVQIESAEGAENIENTKKAENNTESEDGQALGGVVQASSEHVQTEGIPEVSGGDLNMDTETQGEEESLAASDTAAGEVFNGSDGVYIVEEGDTLAIISRKMYGDISHADAISRMNGLTDGNLIYIGQKLLLP